MRTLVQSGLDLVEQGETTHEEVIRVLGDVREEGADPEAALAVLVEFPGRRQDAAAVVNLWLGDLDPDGLATGLRVEAVWKDDRVGHITDLAGFVPVDQMTAAHR